PADLVEPGGSGRQVESHHHGGIAGVAAPDDVAGGERAGVIDHSLAALDACRPELLGDLDDARFGALGRARYRQTHEDDESVETTSLEHDFPPGPSGQFPSGIPRIAHARCAPTSAA